MNQIPDALYSDQDMTTWVVIGASRGIGLEFVRQLLVRGEKIIATVRQPWAEHASALWGHSGNDHGRCQMFVCDILSEASIVNFVHQLVQIPNLKIDYVVINAGVLRYPNHMAAELKRKDDDTIILALHPGEVATDMSNIQLPWTIQGQISPEVSVAGMIDVIQSKGIQHSGTFWTWENQPHPW
ncbi:hypothetical protein IWX49DRAFT_210701 [Phyllosticta citricarpa]|uniref:Uncharacterized protein n=2 Tax=Phyllosticta TaxID=121621 RepID=A0ABR1MQ08_9PEZI